MGIVGIDRDCCITEQLEKRIQSRYFSLSSSSADSRSAKSSSTTRPLATSSSSCPPRSSSPAPTPTRRSGTRRCVASSSVPSSPPSWRSSRCCSRSPSISFRLLLHLLHSTRPGTRAALRHLHAARARLRGDAPVLARVLRVHHPAEHHPPELHAVVLAMCAWLRNRPRTDGHGVADRGEALRPAEGLQLLLHRLAGELQPVALRVESHVKMGVVGAQLPAGEAVRVAGVAGGKESGD